MTPGDRGSFSLELVTLFGVLLLLVLLVVQASSWWFDRQVALGAAREGAAVAADTQNGGQDPVQVASAFLQRGGWLVEDARVDPPVQDPAARTVTVTVHVRVRSVLGSLFDGPDISVPVTVPIERFVGAGG
ncbi:TadE/TadG family type IV pilus assembly protein [Streptacidiphilus neutrinimicus]|uniref:TadE/TadG family type IV pilus assembly protein n=1 Tax=Streptacidiphilus neutrinimicus TaxID=105420 RepID=UPI0006941EE2|nr:TadE/TadG family type IV pilus assembly protein [Streptacidiphilus neutrinimicus]